jgi:hypothetical protein
LVLQSGLIEPAGSITENGGNVKSKGGRLRSFLRTASKGGTKLGAGRRNTNAPATSEASRPGPTIVTKKEAEKLIASAGISGEGDKEAEADKAQFIKALRNAVATATSGDGGGEGGQVTGDADDVDISDLVVPGADYKDDLSRLRAQLEAARLEAAAGGGANADADSSDFFSEEEG